MSRRSPTLERPTNSAAIVAVKQAHPDWKPKEIVESLEAAGFEITRQQVSNVLHREKVKGDGHSNGHVNRIAKHLPDFKVVSKPRKKRRRRVADVALQLTMNELIVTKKFIREVGGVEKAKTLVGIFSELV